MNRNILISLLVAIIVVGGIIYLVAQNMQANPNNQYVSTTTPETPSPTPSPTPAPTPEAAAPLVSTNLTTVSVSNSTAVVSGNVTPNGAQTTYWFEYGRTASLGSRTTARIIGSGYVGIPVPGYLTGLSANTNYYLVLKAQNRFGVVTSASSQFKTNSNPPPTVHNAPTTDTQAATSISRTTANLNGQVNPNGSPTAYWFEYGESTALESSTALQAANQGVVPVSAAVSLSNLKPLTKYYFRVDAENQYGTINGSILSFTTPGPAAPAAPQADTTAASKIATSSATLNGKANPGGGETTYQFEYTADSTFGSGVTATTQRPVSGTGTSWVSVSNTATGLQSNTKYYYRILVSNSLGTVRGDIASFTTK